MFLRLITDKALKKLIEKEVNIHDKEWNRFLNNEVMLEVEKLVQLSVEEGENRKQKEIDNLKDTIKLYRESIYGKEIMKKDIYKEKIKSNSK